jgi:hypothetical protein
MPTSNAPREKPEMDDRERAGIAKSNAEQVKRESSAQYKNSIDKVNRSQDRDIERALRRF